MVGIRAAGITLCSAAGFFVRLCPRAHIVHRVTRGTDLCVRSCASAPNGSLGVQGAAWL